MAEFTSRWLSPEPAKTAICVTDKTDRIGFVSFVSASHRNFERFSPLDAAIIASEAGRRPLAEIENRLRRLTARAAAPTATPRDHQLARDWTAIREAKRQGREAA